MILTLAARNSRNNNAFYVNATIKQEDYNREPDYGGDSLFG
jgi:hypothetical protein